MTAEITFSQVWANPSLRNFFFTTQAEDTLQELSERAVDFEDAQDRIEDYANRNGLTLDDIADMFHSFGDSNTLEELAEEFEIELNDEEDEEDDDQ